MRRRSMSGYQVPERKNDQRKVLLYVEGKDDKEIIEQCWLPRYKNLLKDIRVEAVDSGGCKQVLARVQADLSDPEVIAIGLLDRDALMQSSCGAKGREVFLETDDKVYDAQASSVFGSTLERRILVLRHLELENLLLISLPALMQKQLHRRKGVPAWTDPENTAEQLVQMAEELLPRQAARLCAVQRPDPQPKVENPGGHLSKPVAPTQSESDLLAKYSDWLDPDSLNDAIRQLRAFDAPPGSPFEVRWKHLNRIAKGKWMITLLCRRWIDLDADPLKRDLAHTIADKGKEHFKEVENLFDVIVDRARTIAHEHYTPPPGASP